MPATRKSSERSADLEFVRRVFIVIVIGALVAAVWALSDILLLLFGATLLAVMLHAIAPPPASWGVGFAPRSLSR